jgi:BON domain-containing protein
MGEYEDRYPDAYGRDAVPAPASPAEERKERYGRDRLSLRSLFGGASDATPPAGWQQGRAVPAQPIEPQTIEPTPLPERRTEQDYRGVGPRGYVRSPTRIYEDICDRLTDHPLLDASDIEVLVTGIEVILRGSVENAIAARRAEAIAWDVAGVKTVRNELKLRTGGER